MTFESDSLSNLSLIRASNTPAYYDKENKHVDNADPPGPPLVNAGEETGNVRPLLHELQHALRALIDDNTERQIDLRSLPLTSFEEARIETLLGSGEVRALINSLGNSEVRETAFAGVWVVTHFNEAGDVVGKYIEVTHCPWLLQAQREDVRDAVRRLERLLDD